MSDPSFDDLLESLDAIQAERSHQRRDSSSSSSSSDSDGEGKKKRGGGGFEEHEYQESFLPPPPPPQHHSPPPQQHHAASIHVDFSPSHVHASYSPPSHSSHSSHDDHSYKQAQRDHAPVETYSAPVHHTNHAATPSRSGDMKQYQRQSVIQPSRATHHAGDSHCAKCGNSLYGTEFVTAGGKNYHQDHFTCVKCHKHLVGAYYDHHNQVYCPNCAGELMPCTKCHRGITGQYMILDGRPYHNECVERKHCAHCHGPIEDTVLTALGKTWHTRCFKCIQCGKELGKEFISKDGHGQCVNCADRARPACEKCHNPLSGEFINFQNHSYHQDCFVCAQCRTRLGTSGFYNVHGQLKCSRCAK